MTLGMVYLEGFSKEKFSEVNKESGTLSARPEVPRRPHLQNFKESFCQDGPCSLKDTHHIFSRVARGGRHAQAGAAAARRYPLVQHVQARHAGTARWRSRPRKRPRSRAPSRWRLTASPHRPVATGSTASRRSPQARCSRRSRATARRTWTTSLTSSWRRPSASTHRPARRLSARRPTPRGPRWRCTAVGRRTAPR
jgi:hypothetical protein